VLLCDFPGVPTDGTNLVMKAAAMFRREYPDTPFVRFTLDKRTPHGAGLGGGSSDAAAALNLLNEEFGRPFSFEQLAGLAAGLGSDCPLFLDGAPVFMRGRGERIERLSVSEKAALTGRRLLLFKPDFGVSTVEAYKAMKADGGMYCAEIEAETALKAWRLMPAKAPLPLYNNMERAVFAKHLALPALLDGLRSRFALAPRMSGSGSACFAFLPPGFDAKPVIAAIREAWGESAFVTETTLR
jgi:4-diphosphocytidyl-2-C-methyl-D-erythritol kinase